MKSLHIEFSQRIDQLMNDGKGEVQAFELAAQEFKNQIMDVTLSPLCYLFIDYSSVTFKDDNIYFNL